MSFKLVGKSSIYVFRLHISQKPALIIKLVQNRFLTILSQCCKTNIWKRGISFVYSSWWSFRKWKLFTEYSRFVLSDSHNFVMNSHQSISSYWCIFPTKEFLSTFLRSKELSFFKVAPNFPHIFSEIVHIQSTD